MFSSMPTGTRRRLAALVAVGASGLGAAPAVAAAAGHVGDYSPVQTTCFHDRLLVTSPNMNATLPNPLLAADGSLIFNPNQWVAFRPHVARWTGTGWAHYASGSWKAVQSNPSGITVDSWFIYDAGGWGGGGTEFPVSEHGAYAVYAEYYWWGVDGLVDSGYDNAFTPLHYVFVDR